MKQKIRTKENDFSSFVGFEIVESNANGAKIKLDIKPHHLNAHGIAHGGVAASLLDTSIGVTIFQVTGRKCVTVNLNLSYLEPIKENQVVFANGKVIRAGKSMATAEGEIIVNDRVAAKAIGSFKLL